MLYLNLFDLALFMLGQSHLQDTILVRGLYTFFFHLSRNPEASLERSGISFRAVAAFLLNSFLRLFALDVQHAI